MNNVTKLFDKTIFLKLDKKQKWQIGLISIAGVIWISIFSVRQISLMVTLLKSILLFDENNLSVLLILNLFTSSLLNIFISCLPVALGFDFSRYATEKDKSWRFSFENLFYCLAATIVLIILNFLGG